MLKIFLGILAVILVVALLTNRTDEPTPATVTLESPAASQGAAAQPANGASAAKLNPPHGQPGHSCDIAVGAPLPASPAAAAPTAPSSAAPKDLSPRKTDTRVAINPPHGEPGHSCSVPVGRPLPQK